MLSLTRRTARVRGIIISRLALLTTVITMLAAQYDKTGTAGCDIACPIISPPPALLGANPNTPLLLLLSLNTSSAKGLFVLDNGSTPINRSRSSASAASLASAPIVIDTLTSLDLRRSFSGSLSASAELEGERLPAAWLTFVSNRCRECSSLVPFIVAIVARI